MRTCFLSSSKWITLYNSIEDIRRKLISNSIYPFGVLWCLMGLKGTIQLLPREIKFHIFSISIPYSTVHFNSNISCIYEGIAQLRYTYTKYHNNKWEVGGWLCSLYMFRVYIIPHSRSRKIFYFTYVYTVCVRQVRIQNFAIFSFMVKAFMKWANISTITNVRLYFLCLFYLFILLSHYVLFISFW